MNENPRASVPPAAVADPQPSDRGSGVPGVSPAWQRLLDIYATPELFLAEVFRLYEDDGVPFMGRLSDPLTPTRVLRQVTDGHPVRRT